MKDVTIVTLFSGRWACIYQYFKGLGELDFDKDKTNILFYDNSCDKDFGTILQTYLAKNGKRFRGCRYVVDESFPWAGHGDVKELAVARILENVKKYVDTEYLFTLEDDTTCPDNTLRKLFPIFDNEKKVGAAQGVEVGRWDEFTIGASGIDEVYHYPPKEKQPEIVFKGYLPLPDQSSGVEEIGGGGFYSTLFLTKVFKKIDFDERFLPMITGTDVACGPKMRRLGYRWLIDWSIRCTHFTVSPEDLRTIPITCEHRNAKRRAKSTS